MFTQHRIQIAALITCILLAMTGVAGAVNPNSGTTDEGATLTVQIDSPADGSTVGVGDIANATGMVSLVDSMSAETSVSYVIDLSGSTTFTSGLDCNGDGVVDTGDDLNGNGSVGDIADCEVAGILALNDSIRGADPTVNLTAFGAGAAAADMSPDLTPPGNAVAAAGDDPFTGATVDANTNGIADLEEVARSVRNDNVGNSAIGLFTDKVVGSSTNFTAGLTAMNGAFDTRPADENKIAFFLTDGDAGFNADTDPALQEAVNDGIRINTYSIGAGSRPCNPGEPIYDIAERTGGECTEVADPSDLSSTLGGASPADIERVDVALNGATPVQATINALGTWTADGLGNYAAGQNTITATAVADDGTTVTADITVTTPPSTNVLTLTPETARVPLGEQHCLVAQLSDDGGQPVADAQIDFLVTGPNSTDHVGVTDEAGMSEFCYVGETAGSDTVRASSSGVFDTSVVTWLSSDTGGGDGDGNGGGGDGNGGGGGDGNGGGVPVRPAGLVTLTISDALVDEGDLGTTEVDLTMSLSRPLSEDLTVSLGISGVANGEAVIVVTEPAFAQSGFADVLIKAGDTNTDMTILIQGDFTPEPTEAVTVTVLATSSDQVDLSDPVVGMVFIIDDDDITGFGALSPMDFSDGCVVPTNMVGLRSEVTPTSAAIANLVVSCADTTGVDRVLLGRDDDFADAMASGYLQGDAPLLLVPSRGPLPPEVRSRLQMMDPAEVILLGGTEAISDAVAAEVRRLGPSTVRRSGATRIETAIDIASQDAPTATTALIARAFADEDHGELTQAFADAISVGGWAADAGFPVLLTESNRLTPSTMEYLATSGIQDVMIMGGTAAIAETVAEDLRSLVPGEVQRVSGPSRFGTAIAVAERRGASDAGDVDNVIVVDGTSPDAWVGGFTAAYLSAQQDAPVVLMAGEELPAETGAWLGGAQFAQADDLSMTCVTTITACLAARSRASLDGGQITFSPASLSLVQAGQALTVDTQGVSDVTEIVYGGSCLFEETTDASALEVRTDGAPSLCTLEVTATFPSGETQTFTAGYVVG